MGWAQDNNGTADEYDLPPADKGAALAVASSKAPNGSAKVDDNDLVEDQNARWVERTGWAPRFGPGTTADPDDDNAMDRQTWLESRLDDKFFGGRLLTPL